MLPEKWFVIRNESNYTVLNEWNNNKYNNSASDAVNKDFAKMFSDKNYTCTGTRKEDENYVEISFEQFMSEVLKQSNTEINENYSVY